MAKSNRVIDNLDKFGPEFLKELHSALTGCLESTKTIDELSGVDMNSSKCQHRQEVIDEAKGLINA